MGRRAGFKLWGVGLLWIVGCSGAEEDRPPPVPTSAGQGSPAIPECEEPEELDTSAACNAETVELYGRKPTIYFVLDVSGSMLDYIPRGGETKLDAAKSALVTVAEEIGPRSKYGMATFPAASTADDDILGCSPGEEVFSIQAGDPKECANLPARGPVFDSFVRTLARVNAGGGTPLAPTLDSLTSTIMQGEGRTAVVVITDGAPNCNAESTCEASGCSHNRYGSVLYINGVELPCNDETNCCSEEVTGIEFANLYCVDENASVQAIETLGAAGIPTYVIGVLGSQDFDDVMNELAIAGGTARDGNRMYFDVESLSELTDTVRAIGLDFTQTCEIELVEPPALVDQFNVYFDGEVVPSDPDDGWTLSEGIVTLHGEACAKVESGEVEKVQLLSGCQTVVVR